MKRWVVISIIVSSATLAHAQEAVQPDVLFLQGNSAATAQQCSTEKLPARLLPEQERACLLSIKSLHQERAFAAARERIAALQHVRSSSSFRAALQLTLADGYYLEGNWTAAQQAYQTAAEYAQRTPLHPLALYGLARMTQYQGNLAKARELFAQMARLAPWSFEAESAREILNDDAYLSVQVGAFHDRENAVKLLKDLQRQGYQATIQEVNVKGQAHFRVRAGRFTSYAEAKSMQDELDRLGYSSRIYP